MMKFVIDIHGTILCEFFTKAEKSEHWVVKGGLIAQMEKLSCLYPHDIHCQQTAHSFAVQLSLIFTVLSLKTRLSDYFKNTNCNILAAGCVRSLSQKPCSFLLHVSKFWCSGWLPDLVWFISETKYKTWVRHGITLYNTIPSFNPLPHNATFWCTEDIYSFGKRSEKRENCLYMAFIFHLQCTLKCRLQFVSVWTGQKFCRLVMVKDHKEDAQWKQLERKKVNVKYFRQSRDHFLPLNFFH